MDESKLEKEKYLQSKGWTKLDDERWIILGFYACHIDIALEVQNKKDLKINGRK
jgi:hypothetical protein